MHQPQKAQVLNCAYVCQTPLFKKKKKNKTKPTHDRNYLNSDSAPSQQHNIPAYN